MRTLLSEFASKIKESLLGIDNDAALRHLVSGSDVSPIVAFYCAASIIGEDILEYENETVLISLIRMGCRPDIANTVAMAKTLIVNMDDVLTVPSAFKVAVDLFCDNDVETHIVDYKEPAKIIWTLIVLMAINGAENIPINGDALRYVVACLKSDGWTMPPFMLNIQKISDFFEYYDEEYYSSIECSQKDALMHCGINSDAEKNTSKENFLELHKPIFQLLLAKSSELQKELNKLQERL
jgi:hypothetical protein